MYGTKRFFRLDLICKSFDISGIDENAIDADSAEKEKTEPMTEKEQKSAAKDSAVYRKDECCDRKKREICVRDNARLMAAWDWDTNNHQGLRSNEITF